MKLFITWARPLGFIAAVCILALFKGSLSNKQSSVEIAGESPMNLAVGVAPNARITVTFAGEMNAATVTPASVQLLDSGGNVVPVRLSYNFFNKTVTLDPQSPLNYGVTYQLLVKNGKNGVQDIGGNGLLETLASSFTVAGSPLKGAGGPLLVVTSPANPFSTYYPEILRAEGFNEFFTAEASTLSPNLLSKFGLVILGDIPLTSEQLATLSDWVNGGGKLIAMHPRAELSELLGITHLAPALADGYFVADPGDQTSAGIVGTAIQFHGEAEGCTPHGARTLAHLYRDANTAIASPAVTLRSVGKNGGMAGAFMFDLAKSVVLTRQGNPAWAGQRRTGSVWGQWTQSADLFCGSASFDPQRDWCDRNNIAIPQADEQQRLLANMIVCMNLPAAPLPRFGYFPSGAKAVVVLTGDDHNSGGTPGRFAQVKAAGISGGLPISATSYLFPGAANSDATLASCAAQGFESALHLETTNGALFGNSSDVPADWISFSQLNYLYTSEQFIFNLTYPSLPSPRTVRIHGPVWSDYDSLPQVEFAHGVRLDTSYYFSPPQWVRDHPGFFTGSGIPMRFATAEGKMIDVYQVPTLITDESGQSEPRTIDTLLDNAMGSKEYFGAFAVNAHDDDAVNPVADAVIASAKRHDVPIMSAENLLNFEDGRGNSFFSDHSWNASTGRLTFSITRAAGSAGLEVMVPFTDAAGMDVAGVNINGSAVSYRAESFSGIRYALFPAQNGLVTVQYNSSATE